MKNLKLLIIILTLLAVGITCVIITLNFINVEENENLTNINKIEHVNNNNIIIDEQIKEYQNQIYQNTTSEEQLEEENKYSDLEMMQIYLADFQAQVFNNVGNAYNLLNEEYREKRFGNIDRFKQYITEKQHQLSNIKIMQYKVEEGYDYTVYKGTDEHGNYYHIIKNENMEYSIILDNYTMQDYSDASTVEKIEKSVEKFILMLNSADYWNAYNVLEQTFKAAYFPTEQDFINYIKNNWFARNIIASKEVTEEGVCIITIKDSIALTANKIQKQFKVNLGEEMEFTIEFSI